MLNSACSLWIVGKQSISATSRFRFASFHFLFPCRRSGMYAACTWLHLILSVELDSTFILCGTLLTITSFYLYLLSTSWLSEAYVVQIVVRVPLCGKLMVLKVLWLVFPIRCSSWQVRPYITDRISNSFYLLLPDFCTRSVLLLLWAQRCY